MSSPRNINISIIKTTQLSRWLYRDVTTQYEAAYGVMVTRTVDVPDRPAKPSIIA